MNPPTPQIIQPSLLTSEHEWNPCDSISVNMDGFFLNNTTTDLLNSCNVKMWPNEYPQQQPQLVAVIPEKEFLKSHQPEWNVALYRFIHHSRSLKLVARYRHVYTMPATQIMHFRAGEVAFNSDGRYLIFWTIEPSVVYCFKVPSLEDQERALQTNKVLQFEVLGEFNLPVFDDGEMQPRRIYSSADRIALEMETHFLVLELSLPNLNLVGQFTLEEYFRDKDRFLANPLLCSPWLASRIDIRWIPRYSAFIYDRQSTTMDDIRNLAICFPRQNRFIDIVPVPDLVRSNMFRLAEAKSAIFFHHGSQYLAVCRENKAYFIDFELFVNDKSEQEYQGLDSPGVLSIDLPFATADMKEFFIVQVEPIRAVFRTYKTEAHVIEFELNNRHCFKLYSFTWSEHFWVDEGYMNCFFQYQIFSLPAWPPFDPGFRSLGRLKRQNIERSIKLAFEECHTEPNTRFKGLPPEILMHILQFVPWSEWFNFYPWYVWRYLPKDVIHLARLKLAYADRREKYIWVLRLIEMGDVATWKLIADIFHAGIFGAHIDPELSAFIKSAMLQFLSSN